MTDPAPAPGAPPLVSVVTVCMNSAATLERTIRSVLAQDYPRVEYIIVDGGSTDGTLDIIERHADDITRWISEPDGGIYDAMNKGIGLAGGDLLILVNSDDYLEPDAVSVAAGAWAKHPDAEILHGQVRVVDAQGREKYVMTREPDVGRLRYRQLPVLHPAAFITRAAYDKVGPYDTAYRSSADDDWFQRALNLGLRFHYVEAVLSNMQAGGHSARNFLRAFGESRAIRIRHGCPPLRAHAYYLRSCVLFILVHRILPRLGCQGLYRRWRRAGAASR